MLNITKKSKIETPTSVNLNECLFKVFSHRVISGCNLDEHDENGETPLICAVKKGLFKCVELLVKRGCNLDLQDNDGLTALMHACKKESYKIVEYLVTNGCNTDTQDNDGMTALMHSIDTAMFYFDCGYFSPDWDVYEQDCIKLCKILIGKCNLNIQNESGQTALHVACTCEDRTEIVDILLKAGSNPFIKDEREDDAIYYCRIHEDSDLLDTNRECIINFIHSLIYREKVLILCAMKYEKGNIWFDFPLDMTKEIFKYVMFIDSEDDW